MTSPRPHDLVRVSHPVELLNGAPEWVSRALALAPWAVVRRDISGEGHLPVGVRGKTREQRWGAVISATNIAERLAPEQLLDRVKSLPLRTPAARALAELSERLKAFPVRWGPTGSAGFELATGLRTLNAQSDLDILIRAQFHLDLPAQWALLAGLRDGFADLPARVDAQVDFNAGAVALDELLSGADEVLAKTPTGPVLMPVAPLLDKR